jgi:predicted ABC-type ATPase
MSAPLLVFLAGPNGAGKSTFFKTFLANLGLCFVNADAITQKTGIPNAESARAADALRVELLAARTSFVSETVFSDPKGAKLTFLRDAIAAGYDVKLIYIGLSSVMLSEARVSMRVEAGGHDVPSDRLARRYEQSLKNLHAAIGFVPEVHVYDNSSSEDPYRTVLVKRSGKIEFMEDPLPSWLAQAPSTSKG